MLVSQKTIHCVTQCNLFNGIKWKIFFFVIRCAATCFRNAKQLDLCKDALMKAADCHKQNRGLFHAARCYEQVCCLIYVVVPFAVVAI